VSFLWFQIPQLAVSVLILVCTFMGALLTVLVGTGRELRRALTIRSLRGQVASRDKRIKELEDQIQQAGVPLAETEREPLILPPNVDM